MSNVAKPPHSGSPASGSAFEVSCDEVSPSARTTLAKKDIFLCVMIRTISGTHSLKSHEEESWQPNSAMSLPDTCCLPNSYSLTRLLVMGVAFTEFFLDYGLFRLPTF